MTTPSSSFGQALADHYVIERELGRGGMATVYLAEDVKHHRKVAVKVLRDDISASVGATRFLREIQIAAQLQHPNILPLLDSGTADGRLYYVMPYVEGTTLRQRLARGGELPVGEAVRILVEVADALAYAHAHGVVHRDIKPDNIMLSGRHAVVADFGVARALSEATGASTVTSLGVALGTPAYMAPEQALADPHVDQRADLYALGVVAYELLAGQPPFTGSTPQQVLSAHVTMAPEALARHRPGLSPELEQTVMRCLEKRAADRWQTAEALLAALEPLATPSGGLAPTAARLAPIVPLVRRRGLVATVAVVGAVLLVAAFFALRATRSTSSGLTFGKSDQLTSDVGLEIQPDISPDGKLVAYAAGNAARMRIYIRPVGGGRTIPLSDDSSAVEQLPKWSPDGSRILYLLAGDVRVAPSLGGSSRALIAGAEQGVKFAGWSPDGTQLWVVRGDSLLVFTTDGGSPRVVTTRHEVHSCAWQPGGDWLACVQFNSEAVRVGRTFGNVAPSRIILVPTNGGSPNVLSDTTGVNLSPVWTPDGSHLLFISNRDGPRDVYAMAVDRAGRPGGVPERLTTGLGATSISLSADGARVAYSVYTARSNIFALPIVANGVVSGERATPMTNGNQVIESMSVSPDGRWLLYDSDLGGRAHVWRMPIGGGQAEQLTNGPADEFAPDLSPDGRWLAYHSWRTGTRDIEVKAIGGGEPERVTATPAQESYPAWSPDGMSVVFYDQVVPTSIWIVRRDGPGRWSAPRKFAAPASQPAWSPDGASIAYIGAGGNQAGDVFVQAVAGNARREVFHSRPGVLDVTRVAWSHDGRQLFMKVFDQAGRASIWSMSASGGEPRLIARLDDVSRSSSRADFAVDATRIYFPLAERQADVYVASLAKRR